MTQLKLPIGTLLLDPGDGLASPALWSVKSATKLICARDGVIAEATLTKSGLPEGWKIINNRAIARELAKHLAELTKRGDKLPSLFEEDPNAE